MRELGTVLVTGGSSGLGAAVVAEVAAAGGTPVVLDRAEPAGHRHPEGGGRNVRFEQVDLADGRAAEEAVRRVGPVDAVVTAAGTDTPAPLDALDPAAWERIVAINLFGTAAVVRAALPSLKERRGRVVTVASTLGFRVFPHATAYCASKFGVVGFTRALAVELAGEVGVTMLVPGGMRTRFFDGREEEYKPGPDAQLNDPRDVARSVVFALGQPEGCEVRELVVTPANEPSWP